MARILYQAKTGPVPTPAQAPEQVTESRWHQPLTEPARRRALPLAVVAAGLCWVPQPVPTATPEKWQRPFAEPMRAASRVQPDAVAYVPNVAPAAEVVTLDKWFLEFARPVQRPGLRTAAQQHAAFVKADPFPEATDAGRWFAPLSESPVKTRPGLAAAQQAAWPVKATPFAEAASVDRWLNRLSEPQRQPLGLSARLQQTLAFWPYPLVNPDAPAWVSVVYPGRVPGRPFPAHFQQALAFIKAAPFAEAVTADRWVRPLNEPTRRIAGVAWQQAGISGPALPFVAGPDRWLQPLAGPPGAGRRILPDGAWFVTSTAAAETITADKWFAPWQIPARAQQRPAGFVAGSLFADASAAAWWQPAVQPAQRRVFVGGHQAAISGPALPIIPSASSWSQPLAPPTRREPRPITGESASPYFVPPPVDLNSIEWFAPLSEPRRRVVSIESWQSVAAGLRAIFSPPTPERRTVHVGDRDRVVAVSRRGRVITARRSDRKIITE